MILKQIYLYPDLIEFSACPEDRLAAQDQTRHICNYLERNLSSLKFEANGFNKICFVGYSRPAIEMHINSSNALCVPIAFDMKSWRQMPREKMSDFFADMLRAGLQKCADNYEIPLENMLQWLSNLCEKNYRNEWDFREKSFRQEGIKCRLKCSLTLDAFALRLLVLRKEVVVFDKVILETVPDEVAYHYRFKDIVVERGKLVVTSKLHGEDKRVLYEAELSDFE